MILQKLFCSEAACLKINPDMSVLLSSYPKITHALNNACKYLVIPPCILKKKDVKKRFGVWIQKKPSLKIQSNYRHYVYRLDRQMDIYIKATYVSTVDICRGVPSLPSHSDRHGAI